MIPEAPFLSVAALSVTLAGFAGLVAAFRRGAEWKAMDVFRLREIAEFCLGNALITLLVVPLSTTTGDLPTALRICGVLGVLLVVGGGLMLIQRYRVLDIPRDRGWYTLPAVVDIAAIASAVLTVLNGTIGFFEWELLFLLARPMIVFVLVLSSLRHD